MKTITPLELVTSLSIFACDDVLKTLRYTIGIEVGKDSKYLELRKLCDDETDVDDLMKRHENLNSYIIDNLGKNIISTIITLNSVTSAGQYKINLSADEQVKVIGTVSEFIMVYDYLLMNENIIPNKDIVITKEGY
ncbi:hypothetical protein NVV56_09430 [Aeromonas dhakensis]|uniref:hypothetical protein n=1 Tax=Aeromonas dhakensis TaxID=196024 RepID=UPI0021582B42|nr:hypothetical protein [Aeromonas dhakensis]MCR6739111.1 hypothetical protein [Aeromonas dhakensis]